jgi:hypothetical protein
MPQVPCLPRGAAPAVRPHHRRVRTGQSRRQSPLRKAVPKRRADLNKTNSLYTVTTTAPQGGSVPGRRWDRNGRAASQRDQAETGGGGGSPGPLRTDRLLRDRFGGVEPV